jgi:hypothetical protein
LPIYVDRAEFTLLQIDTARPHTNFNFLLIFRRALIHRYLILLRFIPSLPAPLPVVPPTLASRCRYLSLMATPCGILQIGPYSVRPLLLAQQRRNKFLWTRSFPREPIELSYKEKAVQEAFTIPRVVSSIWEL